MNVKTVSFNQWEINSAPGIPEFFEAAATESPFLIPCADNSGLPFSPPQGWFCMEVQY